MEHFQRCEFCSDGDFQGVDAHKNGRHVGNKRENASFMCSTLSVHRPRIQMGNILECRLRGLLFYSFCRALRVIFLFLELTFWHIFRGIGKSIRSRTYWFLCEMCAPFDFWRILQPATFHFPPHLSRYVQLPYFPLHHHHPSITITHHPSPSHDLMELQQWRWWWLACCLRTQRLFILCLGTHHLMPLEPHTFAFAVSLTCIRQNEGSVEGRMPEICIALQWPLLWRWICFFIAHCHCGYCGIGGCKSLISINDIDWRLPHFESTSLRRPRRVKLETRLSLHIQYISATAPFQSGNVDIDNTHLEYDTTLLLSLTLAHP